MHARPALIINMNKITVLGVCAGNGVCLFPFKSSKFEILGNIEPRPVFYDKLNHQWDLNFPNIPQRRAPFELNTNKKFDIIIGHPDCGHASVLRRSRAKKNISAKGNVSLGTFINSIITFKPKIWLMENLPGLLKTYSKAQLKEIFPGYNLKFHISSVSAYGNSQVTRERLVIVGIRKDLNTKGYFKLPDMSSLVRNAEDFEFTQFENPNIGHVREPLAKECNLYYGDKRKITYSLAQQLWLTKFKETSKWPIGGKMKNQPGVSKNMKGRPPFTVRKQNRQFNTMGLVLSPREMADIQGLPIKFKIIFPTQDKIYWLNKWRCTVTKCMPFEIANWFAKKAYKTLKNL